MPSPVGHTLGALAAAWMVQGTTGPTVVIVKRSLWIAAIGMAPDLDLLIGRHSAETHSVGAALIAGSLAALMRWPVAATRARIFWTVALAWFSHPLLDFLGEDNTPPFGVMLLWPLSSEHYLASVSVFDPISRRWWLPGFLIHNLMAALRELMILGPIAAAAWLTSRWRGRRTATRKGSSAF